jgi:hypothetical protein
MSPEEARYSALRALGGLMQIEEQCYDTRGVNIIENLVRDLRYGLRQLRRSPGFSALAILSLTLGIGVPMLTCSVGSKGSYSVPTQP